MATFKTNREFFNAIVNGTEITTDMVDFAKSAIEKMDSKNKNRRETMTKEQEANEVMKSDILTYMKENGRQSAKSLADYFEVSTQKISALMKQLADNGKITTVRDKFEGSSSRVNVYSLVES
jgi:predicted HTH transcriptional regulator